MKIREIRTKAKVLRLKNSFGLSKAELIRRIQKAEGQRRRIVINSTLAFERIV